MTSLPPSFTCASGEEHVPYTLVCDYRQDCLDNSDEDFCAFPTCHATKQFQCESKQCVTLGQQCDHLIDCLDETDERSCNPGLTYFGSNSLSALVTLDGRGSFTTTRLPYWNSPCPDTHFKCLSIELCMPIYLRCNGVNDCPEKEDEEGCDDSWTCPGFYRCRGFMNTFLHPDHLCDGWSQCPQHDDERFCNLTCPAQCSCLGHSWFCRQIFQANMYPWIRFLHAENSGMKPSCFTENSFLIHLSLSNCGVVDFNQFTLPNLQSLDLASNQIRVVIETNLIGLASLKTLFLTGNPLTTVFTTRANCTFSFPRLTRLDLSGVKMRSFNSVLLDSFPNLQTLNLSGCGIESIAKAAFLNDSKLRVLDMRGCRLDSFPTDLLKPLTRLSTIHADNYKVCCPVTLPYSFHSNECDSPGDKISSCNDLFKSNLHRVSWNTATFMALVCNGAMFFTRMKGRFRSPSSGVESAADVFVTALFVCGCIHAVYMTIISLADASYRGRYVLQDTHWKHGPVCAAAGFLWILSTEISLLLVGLVTLDRILISWCPRRPLGFSGKSAVVAICVVMVGCVTIALVPLLPSLSPWKLFQQTALCLPLLFDRYNFPGGLYLVGVFSVFNVTVSWLMGLGQLSVCLHLHRRRFAFVQSPNQTKELRTSRRVMAVVLCDVVYWLVIGHNNHLVARGMTVSDNVVVLAQVLVMPFYWTLKPVLYAVAILLEHRRRDQEERMLKILMAKRKN